MLLSWLKSLFEVNSADQGHYKITQQAIEAFVDRIDKRLRLVPGYNRRLGKGMKTAQRYFSHFQQSWPVPLDLSPRTFFTDQRMGLLFSSPESVAALLRTSDALKSFFLQASNGDEAWCFLVMHSSETQRFGVAMTPDGEVQRDVPQTVVSFDAHRLFHPSTSLKALQAHTQEYAFNLLITVISRHLEELTTRRQELENDIMQLRLKKATLHVASPQQVVAGQTTFASLPDTLDGVNARLAELEPALKQAKKTLSLDGLLHEVMTLLTHPERYVKLEDVAYYLNRMGVKMAVNDKNTLSNATRLDVRGLTLMLACPTYRVILPAYVTRQTLQDVSRHDYEI